MTDAKLSEGTEERVLLLFPAAEQESVRTLLREECGTNLPFGSSLNALELERVRFAVLKLSDGDLATLERAVESAKHDWRDVLMWSDFGHDIHAHEKWVPDPHR